MRSHPESRLSHPPAASAQSHPRRFDLQAEEVDETTLQLYPGNPRRGDLDAITDSLRVNGQIRPLMVNRPTRQVLMGNHTLRAARRLGWKTVSVCYVDVDAATARRFVLADNRTSDLATYDLDDLLALISSVDELAGTGYDQAAVDELIEELSAGVPLEPDAVPPVPAKPRTKAGDLIELGPHRLLCADAADPSSYEKLLNGESAAALWTDPPYGVDYVGKTASRMRIANDGADAAAKLVGQAFGHADKALKPGAPLYVMHPSGAGSIAFLQAFQEHWGLRQVLIWKKDVFVLSRSDYHYAHESIAYGFKPGPGRLGRGGKHWFGGNAESSVLEVDRPSASREHPTTKPPELIARCLRNSTRRRDLVLDPFAGSGSTLIACEQLGRGARLIEIDPGYCDVIVARYKALNKDRAKGPS
jgi:site-specific DNA-methyltransferase (adenine-specific)